MDAQARIWYKTDSIILSLQSLHRIIRLKPSTGYEEVWHIRQAPRLPAPFQQSLRPDSAPQHQTSWSSKTLQVGEIQRLQDFPISTTHAYNGRRRADKKYYHYADMKRSEILELRDELTKIDNSGGEDEVFSDDEI